MRVTKEKSVLPSLGIILLLPFTFMGGLVYSLDESDMVPLEGGIDVKSFHLPLSGLLKEKSRKTAVIQNARWKKIKDTCFSLLELSKQRDCYNQELQSLVDYQLKAFDVNIKARIFDGVYTEEITPALGISEKNSNRVLINLHGGGFVYGSRVAGQVESIPVAAIGKIKVVSIDYRKAPEHSFPDASNDVIKVYRELLKDYAPSQIGIYGCSAGGLLAAQSVAWFDKENIPFPGALGLLCFGASDYIKTDAFQIMASIEGLKGFSETENPYQDVPYLKDVDTDNPLVFPVKSLELLSIFPTTLLVSSVRDLALSSTVYTHSQLIKYGVDARLHVWEGFRHCFFYDSSIPESNEVYDVVVNFFDNQLSR